MDPNSLPAIDDIIFLAGGHDSRGEVIAEPDWDELMGRIKDLQERSMPLLWCRCGASEILNLSKGQNPYRRGDGITGGMWT